MAGNRHEIYWSPNNRDMFITWSSEISLYQVEQHSSGDQIPSHYLKLSANTVAYQIASINEIPFAKCIAWFPTSDFEGFFAIGHTNGKVVLTSIFGNADSCPFNGREYLTKHNRPCNVLAWGTTETNLLAAGFEKHRSEHGVVIWDVHKTGNEYSKPFSEIGLGDSTVSLAWFNHQQTLLTGVNNKHLRLYDLRDGGKPQTVTATRAVNGIAIDPHISHRVASYTDSTVCVWDIRNFEKPILSLQQSRSVAKISWCPTHTSFLGVLIKESSSLSLYDIQYNANSAAPDEVDPIPLERGVILTDNSESILSFAWHPQDENRLLFSSSAFSLTDHIVLDRITLNWSPSSKVVWNFGKRILQYIDEKDSVYDQLEDISVTMRKRAAHNYGLIADFSPQSELMQDAATKELWYWVDTCRKLSQSGSHLGINFNGVRSALRMDSDDVKSDLFRGTWSGVESSKLSPVGLYRSEERNQALRLCGWPYDKEVSTLGPLLDRLEADSQISRAAALAVFHLKIRKAIKILTRAAKDKNDATYHLVTMALAGFTDDRNTLWQEMCSLQRNTLNDPYLRAAFAFLTSLHGKYDTVLSETGMLVRDRVGFACTFLSDSQLSEYIDDLSRLLIEEGNLDGMLLTGLTNEGLNLLQSYVDRTGDIQTVSILCLYTSSQEMSKDIRMQQWVNSYRGLLDTWRLWTQRAKFDVQLNKGHPSSAEKIPQQVFVSCNFCGKSISAFVGNKGRIPISRANPNTRSKLSGCPNCRNPLPRCAVCLMHLGSPLASWGGCTSISKSSSIPLCSGSDANKSHPFSSWILWCQSCRHGGHSAHLLQWFGEHPECPVTGCTCRCLNLDAVGHHIPLISHEND